MRIDFHAHVLPNADHGSRDAKTSQAQLALAAAAGVDMVVATPHFYPARDTLEAFLARREAALQTLPAWQGPALAVGAEVHLCAGLEHMPGLEKLRICGTRVILLELPFRSWSNAVLDTVLTLQDDPRYLPVLAHVDRYTTEVVEELFRQGVMGQLNAEGVCRRWGRRRLLRWAEAGSIAALGSDIHGVQTGYDPFLRAEQLLLKRGVQVMDTAQRLLESAQLFRAGSGTSHTTI